MNEEIPIINDLDTSLWGLILQADLVVRLVMLVLLFFSVITWSIIFEKTTKLKRLNKSANNFESLFWSGISIEKMQKDLGSSPAHPMEAVFFSAMKELDFLSTQKNTLKSATKIDEYRIEKIMLSTLNKEIEGLERNISFLATTGSSAPFIGLFGTVWGIMNSFQSIATSKNTSLAIVAPGIAEALLATAFGLLATIPAVIAYNKISSDTNRYISRIEIFIQDLSTILSKNINKNSRNAS